MVRRCPNGVGSYTSAWKKGMHGSLCFRQPYSATPAPLCRIMASAQEDATSMRRFETRRLEYSSNGVVNGGPPLMISTSPCVSANMREGAKEVEILDSIP